MIRAALLSFFTIVCPDIVSQGTLLKQAQEISNMLLQRLDYGE